MYFDEDVILGKGINVGVSVGVDVSMSKAIAYVGADGLSSFDVGVI